MMGVALTVPHTWWLSLPGVFLFFLLVVHARTRRKAVYGSLIVGVLKSGIALIWFFSVYPASWLTSASWWQQYSLITLGWGSVALVLGAPYALSGLFIFIMRTHPWFIRVVTYPIVLLLADLGGAMFFSIYTYAPGSGIHAHFGYAMLGYTLAPHGALRDLAMVGGVSALTLGVGFIATILLTSTTSLILRRQVVVCVCVLLLFVGTAQLETKPMALEGVTVAAVSTSFAPRSFIPEYELMQRQHELTAAVEAALNAGATVTLLPEDARLGYEQDDLAERLRNTAYTEDAMVVDSYRTDVHDDSVVLRGYVYHVARGTTDTTDKRVLVPIGEYLPLLHERIIALLGAADRFRNMRYVPGTIPDTISSPPEVPQVLFCFESSSPSIAHTLHTARPSVVIAHPVSHAWFHAPSTLWNQERNMLIVQSLYAQTPILQAGNLAPSALYTPDGRVTSGTSIYKRGRVETLMFSI
jgi:apolipoprotein N-acyltransferase